MMGGSSQTQKEKHGEIQAFAIGTALRCFVSENRTGSANERMKITGTKIPGTLEPYSSRMPGRHI